MQFRFIKQAYNYYYKNCTIYLNYSDKLNVNPELIFEYEDLYKISVIPSTAFKLHEILSVDPKDVELLCKRSGTKGAVSNVYRDKMTVNNYFGKY